MLFHDKFDNCKKDAAALPIEISFVVKVVVSIPPLVNKVPEIDNVPYVTLEALKSVYPLPFTVKETDVIFDALKLVNAEPEPIKLEDDKVLVVLFHFK